MIYTDQTAAMKNGAPCIIRSPGPSDGAAILDLMRTTSEETTFMARYADEITITVEEEQSFLEKIASSPADIMICAVIDGRIVANSGINPVNSYERGHHRAAFGISILKQYWNLGIGSLLLPAIIDSARAMHYEQIELDAVHENTRAISLYKKFGFRQCGLLPNAFKYRDNAYADSVLMVLEL